MKEKVLIVGPCLTMGGMERAAVNTANGLDDSAKADVVFISLFKKDHFFTLNERVKLEEPNGFNQNSLSILKSLVTQQLNAQRPQVLPFQAAFQLEA